jgi:hypothetical protein
MFDAVAFTVYADIAHETRYCCLNAQHACGCMQYILQKNACCACQCQPAGVDLLRIPFLALSRTSVMDGMATCTLHPA